MKFSIITACLNSEDTIEDTIRCVLAQTHKDIEHIIVDGKSSDGTLEVVRKYANRISKFVSEPDKGIYDAMNKGIQLASGQIIGFLNADDVYAHDSVLAEVATAFNTDHLDAVYGDIVCTRHKDISKVVRYWQTGEYKPRAFFQGWVPPHPTFFCRKCLFQKYGAFNPKYRIAGDFELMLRFIEKHGISVAYIPDTLVRMRMAGKANTIRGVIKGNAEIIDAFKVNGFRPPLDFFWRKPLLKVSQLVKRPANQETSNLYG